MATIKTIEQKAKAYDEAYKRVAVRFGSNVADEIFPELAESEDEKIRKAIYNCVKWFGFDSCFFKDVSQEECLAWLEKQCKNNMGISEATKQKLEDSLNEALEKETPESFNAFLDEQKPAETEKGTNGNDREIPNSALSEEDEEMLENIICDINTARQYVYVKSKCDEEIDWLNSIKDRVQPKQEWSGDDERMLNEVILGLNVLKYKDSGEEEKAACQREIDWLESLKDRVLPQPKQKWSGEDERIIDNLVSQLGNLYARKLIKEETKDKYVNWLKSLKDKSTWKPSDEQMIALNYVVNLMASSESPKENDYYYNVFKDLREQLRKLREEQL